MSIVAVLRIPNAWGDRVKLRVAYQVKDMYGSAVVNRPSRVMMQMGAPTVSLSARTATCSTGNTQQAHHVDYCSACVCGQCVCACARVRVCACARPRGAGGAACT